MNPRTAPNPWAAETFNLTAQGNVVKQMVKAYGPRFGMARARALAKQAGSKIGALPVPKPKPPYQVIVQKRYLLPPTKDVALGFGLAGSVTARTQWTLPVVSATIQFPSSTPSDARCDIAPTNNAQLTLSTADNTVLCTVTFLAGSTIGEFAWTVPAGYAAVPGDLLYLFANEPQDPTFAGINLAFIGRQSL